MRSDRSRRTWSTCPAAARTGTIDRTPLPSAQIRPFFIDRYEVTNRAFKEFIDAGGYERPSYWDGFAMAKDGRPLSFDAAMRVFVDATGRPGPATWELGNYPDGRADYPVTGISWYEAAAYARYRGRSLPTLYHWIKAAQPDTELASSLSVSVTPLSNFASAGPVPVGERQGLGPHGTYDMFGNVREWCSNVGPGRRMGHRRQLGGPGLHAQFRRGGAAARALAVQRVPAHAGHRRPGACRDFARITRHQAAQPKPGVHTAGIR